MSLDHRERAAEVSRPLPPGPVRRAARELALVAALFLAYKLGRVAAAGHVSEALANAQSVWRLERLLHLPSEYGMQHAILGTDWLVRAANCYYAYVHFPVTVACLVWLYVWRPAHYVRIRRTLAWLTALALGVHLLMPLAPPRMIAAFGMVDTGHVVGPAVYGPPTTDTLTNQYAAMPSLHVGWAIVVAMAFVGATRCRWRWLWAAHPIITLLVVLVTGNHYWMDAIVVSVLLGVVLAAASRPALPPVPAPRAGS
nr:phosphatase PAP2 family protein [uncultured Actinoplanes sp.]